MLRNFLRKSVVLLLVSLLACSLLSAFPNRGKRIEVPAAPTVEATGQEAMNVGEEPLNAKTGSETSSENESIVDAGSTSVPDIARYEEMNSIKGDDKAELLALYEAEYQEHMEAEDEVIRLAGRVDELEALNARQADTIARETGNKAYTRATASVGFEEGFSNPSFWLGGAVGARIGKGFLFDVGAEYKLGTLTDPTPRMGVENMRFSTSLGWEW